MADNTRCSYSPTMFTNFVIAKRSNDKNGEGLNKKGLQYELASLFYECYL